MSVQDWAKTFCPIHHTIKNVSKIQSYIVLNFRSNAGEEEIEQKVYSLYSESLIHFFIDLERLGEYSVDLVKCNETLEKGVNMFEVNNKDTRITVLTLFRCLYR